MTTAVQVPRIDLAPGLALSRIAYGAWRLAESDDPGPKATRAKIDACLAQGITTFDHADIYGDYRCETLFGEALRADRSLRARMELVGKCGIQLLSSSRPNTRVKHYDTTAAHVRASVERSLENLGVEHLDLLLIHRPDPLMDHRALGACLDGLVAEGKVRGLGVSNFMPWDFELLQSAMKNPLLTNQIELSLLHTLPFIDGEVALQQRLGKPIMAWSPLGGGRLHGDEPAAQRLAPLLRAKAEAHGTDTTAVALAWLLHHPARIVPVVGTNKLDRIRTLARACDVRFDTQGWYELYSAAQGREVP